MSKQFFLKPASGNGCAVFEITDTRAVVSATLGAATMMYKSEMTVDKAREQYQKLLDRGFVKVSQQEAAKAGFSHNYVWEFYN